MITSRPTEGPTPKKYTAAAVRRQGGVSLADVVQAMDAPSEACSAYINPATGEIVTVTEDDKALIDNDELDEEDLPQWQREQLPKIREALESDQYLMLPGKHDIHDWDIMQRFAAGRENAAQREELLDAIHGSGAFRMFRSAIRRMNLENEWHRFRESAVEQIAKEWLEEHKIAYR